MIDCPEQDIKLLTHDKINYHVNRKMTEKNGTQLAKAEQKKATPIFGTMPTDAIFNPFPPYALRNDCQVGQWKRGEDDFKGSAIAHQLNQGTQILW